MPLRQWQTRSGRRPESSVVPASAASLTDVDFGYVASRPILSRLNLRIPAGKLTMVLGRNGAGKSTLIGVLAGVLRPQRGEVALREVPLRTMRRREIAQQVAVLWQARHSPPGLHVLGLVAKGRFPHTTLLRQWSPEDEAAVTFAIDLMNLGDLQHRPLGSLSGGQLQRAWLAALIAQESPLLILDEPTTHLDVAAQHTTLELLRSLVNTGRTVVASVHDINQTRSADHVILLGDGRVIADGEPQVVLTPPALASVFGVPFREVPDPQSGHPVILVAGDEG